VRDDLVDPYTYAGSDVLKNKLGIRDEGALSKVEYELSAHRIVELRQNPVSGKFDLVHLQAIHGYVFQDVYDWAGQLRSINISKGSTSFAAARMLENYGTKLSKELTSERNLVGLDKVNFVGRLSYFYSELNALHPFREGNGRATREFISAIAQNAGYELDQTRIDNNKGQWNHAAQRSFNADPAPIIGIFMNAVRPSRAIAFEYLPETEALARYPDLKGAYDGLHLMQEMFSNKFKENEQAKVYYSASSRLEILRRLDTGVLLQPSIENSNVLMKQMSANKDVLDNKPNHDIDL
jgi:cell filamentation protein